jgi:cell division protein ZapA
MSKVKVKIYGQEYTIVGDCSEDDIRRDAAHVDEQMTEIGKAFTNNSALAIAVLAAVNISDEYYSNIGEVESLREENTSLKSKADYYSNALEDSKKSTEVNRENETELRKRLSDDASQMRELRDKCSEYENSFFDLQMENIKLKNEIEKLKGNK